MKGMQLPNLRRSSGAIEAFDFSLINYSADVVPLSLLPFKPEPSHGWAGVGYGSVFAALPPLWRSHDRHRGVRARLRAEVAADTEQDRHVMSQSPCERRGFPVPMRWLRAGGDLSRPNHIHQSADRPLMRSERPPKCPTALSRPRVRAGVSTST
jgi:hypothetical protein